MKKIKSKAIFYLILCLILILIAYAVLFIIFARIHIPNYYAAIAAIAWGALCTLALIIIIPIIRFFDERKYKDIDTLAEGEILFKERGNIKYAGEIRNGYLVLTANIIYLFLRDKKPFIQDNIPKEFVKEVYLDNITNLIWMVPNGEITVQYSFRSAKAGESFKIMQDNGWNCNHLF